MTGIVPHRPFAGGRLLHQHQRSNNLVRRSLERLATGKRINRASDDPAGLLLAEGLRRDLTDLKATSRAARSNQLERRQRESGRGEIQRLLINVRGHLVTAADGTNSPEQSRAIKQEIDASLDAINRITNRVDGLANSSDRPSDDIAASVAEDDFAKAAELVESQIESIAFSRAAAGVTDNVEASLEQLRQDQIVITTETLSQVEDADFAEEASNLAVGQILSEASLAALAYLQREQVEQAQKLLDVEA